MGRLCAFSDIRVLIAVVNRVRYWTSSCGGWCCGAGVYEKVVAGWFVGEESNGSNSGCCGCGGGGCCCGGGVGRY